MNSAALNLVSFSGPTTTLLVGGMTDYLENKLIDHIMRGTHFLPPDTLYLGLLKGLPTDTGLEIDMEVGDGVGYARAAFTPSLATISGTQGLGSTTPSNGTEGGCRNNIPVSFSTPLGNWGRITNFAIFDAPQGGNMWVYGYLVQPKSIGAGDPAPYFPPGTVNLRLT